jgi:F-type H+-transporting ATPase subunit a
MLALPPLAAETIFNIRSFTVTNTYINSTIAVLFFAISGFLISRNVQNVPKGLQNFAESVLEIFLSYMDQVTGSRKRSLKFLPLVGSLFLFIIFSNWIGILPGVGSIGIFKSAEGVKEFIPILRPANTDLNMTLSMAVLGVAVSHILGIVTIGFFKYANKFIKLGDLWAAIKKGKPMAIFVAVLEFGVGLLEIISEIAKLVSLSLRLFGNIFAGEVLLTVLGSMVAYLVPLPFLGLELLVGLVQAVVFSMLVLVYISVATTPLAQHSEHSEQHNKAQSVANN